MKTARPVPSTPPIALVTGLRRTIRSIATTTASPTATYAAVCSPKMALVTTKATGPRPVSNAARLSVRSSSGFGGCRGWSGSAGLLTTSRRLARGEHQVVEQLRGQARLEHAPVHALQQQVSAVGVLDPRHRDVARLGRRLHGPIEPPEPVREQLLATHADVAEAGAVGAALEVGGHEGVDVDDVLEHVVVVVVVRGVTVAVAIAVGVLG